MIQSLAVIFFSGLALGSLFAKWGLPRFLGMIVAGLVLAWVGLLDQSLLAVAPELKQIALVILLLRAGLSLNIKDLRRIGRPAVLICLVPASCELVGFVLLAPPLLGLSVSEAAVMGAMVAAVSPAVVLPRMLDFYQRGVGVRQGLPQLMMAGCSVDNVYAIMMFTLFLSMLTGDGGGALAVVRVPVALALGVGCGVGGGWLLTRGLQIWPATNTVKVLLLLALAFVFVALEQYLMISGLLAVISMGATVLALQPGLARVMAEKCGHLWVVAEILLFTLVGAAINLSAVAAVGGAAILLLAGALAFRCAGVAVALLGSRLSKRERLYCLIAYLPKATVQAALGGVPLTLGLACGTAVQAVAVLSIVITAPLGAILMDKCARPLLGAPPPQHQTQPTAQAAAEAAAEEVYL